MHVSVGQVPVELNVCAVTEGVRQKMALGSHASQEALLLS